MNLLILTPYYAPDLGPSAPLYTMLAERLVKRGHEVRVVTTVPHYPSGTVKPAFQGHWIQRSVENGVHVIRVGLPSVKRSSYGLRLLQYACYQLGAVQAEFNQKYDAVIAANPALWTWLPFTYYAVIRQRPAVFSIHDVYPDVGVTLGIFRHKAVIAAVARLERYCLDHAHVVRILSESFRPGIRRLGTPDSKIVLIYDWVDTDLIKPMSTANDFARENGLGDRFTVLYAGNLGLSQGLENVLSAAGLLADQPDIQFVFVGDGPAREGLVTEAHSKQLTNVKFLPFQPRERLPQVLASADVSVVMLRKGIGTASLPSKTLSALASGRPIIASLDAHSETWDLIEKAGAGICIEPENPQELANAIMELKNAPALRERLGRNGRLWAESMHSPESATRRFEDILMEAVRHGRAKSQSVQST